MISALAPALIGSDAAASALLEYTTSGEYVRRFVGESLVPTT